MMPRIASVRLVSSAERSLTLKFCSTYTPCTPHTSPCEPLHTSATFGTTAVPSSAAWYAPEPADTPSRTREVRGETYIAEGIAVRCIENYKVGRRATETSIKALYNTEPLKQPIHHSPRVENWSRRIKQRGVRDRLGKSVGACRLTTRGLAGAPSAASRRRGRATAATRAAGVHVEVGLERRLRGNGEAEGPWKFRYVLGPGILGSYVIPRPVNDTKI